MKRTKAMFYFLVATVIFDLIAICAKGVYIGGFSLSLGFVGLSAVSFLTFAFIFISLSGTDAGKNAHILHPLLFTDESRGENDASLTRETRETREHSNCQ